MKRIACLLLLAASCSSEPARNADTEQVRKAFETWVSWAVAGDGEKVFSGFSDAYKSNWLYERMEAGDQQARRWRGDLTGRARTELDLWFGVAKKRGNGREEGLPASVLQEPSLALLFKTYFALEAGYVRSQLSRITISQVFADASGVTVAIKNGQNTTELYGMVNAPDGWKIDNYRQPLNSGALR